MTIQQALDKADEMQANAMSRKLKLSFLNKCEQMIWEEIIKRHFHTPAEAQKPEINESTDPDTVLLIPSPYDDLYWLYLCSEIDYQNKEMDKYNNDRARYEHARQEAADWINRTRPSITSFMRIRI